MKLFAPIAVDILQEKVKKNHLKNVKSNSMKQVTNLQCEEWAHLRGNCPVGGH